MISGRPDIINKNKKNNDEKKRVVWVEEKSKNNLLVVYKHSSCPSTRRRKIPSESSKCDEFIERPSWGIRVTSEVEATDSPAEEVDEGDFGRDVFPGLLCKIKTSPSRIKHCGRIRAKKGRALCSGMTYFFYAYKRELVQRLAFEIPRRLSVNHIKISKCGTNKLKM